jgi:hypothetical protein
MLPVCRTEGEGFAIPTFDVVPSDVEGFMDELWEFQSCGAQKFSPHASGRYSIHLRQYIRKHTAPSCRGTDWL